MTSMPYLNSVGKPKSGILADMKCVSERTGIIEWRRHHLIPKESRTELKARLTACWSMHFVGRINVILFVENRVLDVLNGHKC